MNEECKTPVEETVETSAETPVEAPAEDAVTGDTAGETAKEPKKAKKNAKADALAAELEAAKAEAAKTKDLFLRTAAEYDNYRKRTTKERDAAFGNGVAHAVEKLLPVIDTLEMAAAAATADENYKKGVTMTLTKAYAVLKDMGVEEIPAQDQPFDPNVHSAMMQQPTEGVEAGIVVQVFQKGYTLNGRVIRHAMVVVSA